MGQISRGKVVHGSERGRRRFSLSRPSCSPGPCLNDGSLMRKSLKRDISASEGLATAPESSCFGRGLFMYLNTPTHRPHFLIAQPITLSATANLCHLPTVGGMATAQIRASDREPRLPPPTPTSTGYVATLGDSFYDMNRW